jgi:hypothetical protein
MSFQLGALPHFATEDQSRHGEFVRVLGLGGSLGFDWSADTRRPRLVGNNDDYLMFAGVCVWVEVAVIARGEAVCWWGWVGWCVSVAGCVCGLQRRLPHVCRWVETRGRV